MKKSIVNLLIIAAIILLFINKYIVIIPLISILFLLNYSKKENNENIKKDNKYVINEVKKLEKQKELFLNKRKLLNDILINTFGKTSITFLKFNSVINNVEDLFNKNVEEINEKLDFLDIDAVIKTRNASDNTLICIQKLLLNNDEIIDKLDKLIIEISNLESTSNIERLYSIEELERLTLNVKKYRRS